MKTIKQTIFYSITLDNKRYYFYDLARNIYIPKVKGDFYLFVHTME